MILRAATYLMVTLLGLTLVAAPSHADRMLIPKLGVNAKVVDVGQRDGAQVSPPNLWRVYHWGPGVKPCAPGSMALTGHNYEVPGGKAVFRHLDRLKVGDVVKIARPGRRGCAYRVTSNRRIRASASVRSCYGWDGPARGCLITCTGRVGPGSYTHRRIVRLVLTPSKSQTSRRTRPRAP